MEQNNENDIGKAVRSLEERVSLLERVVGNIAGQKQATSPAVKAQQYSPVPSYTSETTSAPKIKTSTEIEVGQKWLSVVGVLLIFLAALFFVQYVFQYVDALGKVMLSYGAAAILFGVSVFTKKKYAQFSGVVGAGAWGVTYLVTYAMYFFPATRLITSAPFEMLLLVLVVGALLAAALYQRSKPLVSISLALGVLTMILSPLSLFSIIGTVILLGVFATIAVVFPWGDLVFPATVGAYLSYFFWFADVLGKLPAQGGGLLEKQMLGLIVLVILWIIVAVALMLRRDEDESFGGQTDSMTIILASGGTAILGLFALEELVLVLDSIRFAKAIWFILLAVLMAGWAVLAHEFRNKKDLITAGSIFAIILCMSSISYFLPQQSGGTSIAWAAMGLLIILIGMGVRNVSLAAIAALPFVGSAVRFFVSDMQKYVAPVTSSYSPNLFIGFVLTIAIMGGAALLHMLQRTMPQTKGGSRLAGVLLGVGLCVIYAITAQELAGSLPSVFWSFVALAMVVAGFLAHWKDARLVGLLGLAITIARVFLYDLSNLEALPRVISFAILGGLLLLVGYGYNHNKEKLQKYLIED